MLLSLILAGAAATSPTPEGYTEYPVRLLLSVDKRGKVTDCRPINEAPEKLSEASCKIALEKATYRPARDANGKPIAAQHTLLVRYQIANE